MVFSQSLGAFGLIRHAEVKEHLDRDWFPDKGYQGKLRHYMYCPREFVEFHRVDDEGWAL
jgi:hypothetical protein